MHLLHARCPVKFRGYKYKQDMNAYSLAASIPTLQDLLIIAGQNKRNKDGDR